MKRFIFVVSAVLILASKSFGEGPVVTAGVNYVSRYVGGHGATGLNHGDIQPNVRLDWKNGCYVGVISFAGLDFNKYNENFGSEVDLYGGIVLQNKNCKLDLSYWYYALYDLKKTNDDVNAFIARGFWTSFPGVTPYFHLEFATPNSKSQGPKQGWHWRLGFQRSFKTRWIPIDIDATVRGTENRMYRTKPGISCGMVDLSIPLEFKGVTVSPGLHLMKVNGDPDGPGTGFSGSKNKMWWGLSLSKTF